MTVKGKQIRREEQIRKLAQRTDRLFGGLDETRKALKGHHDAIRHAGSRLDRLEAILSELDDMYDEWDRRAWWQRIFKRSPIERVRELYAKYPDSGLKDSAVPARDAESGEADDQPASADGEESRAAHGDRRLSEAVVEEPPVETAGGVHRMAHGDRCGDGSDRGSEGET